MKIKFIILLATIVFLVVNCKQYKEITESTVKHLTPAEAIGFHQAMTIKIGWYPYEEGKMVKTDKNEWQVVKNDSAGRKSAIPVIIINHPNARDSILLDMNMDNALLGKLIKHSLMTEEAIQRPFSEYFEVAKCETCHPSNIKVNFE